MVKKLALLDWDGTLRKGFTIKDWLKFLAKENIIESEFEEKLSILFEGYRRDELTHDSLSQESAELYASALKNSREQDILLAASSFLNEDKEFINTFSIPFLSYLKRHDFCVAIISGAPAEILKTYQKKLNIDNVFALECEVKDGAYSGKIKSNLGISSQKHKAIHEIKKSGRYMFCLSMGNSSSDIPLLQSTSSQIIVDNPSLASYIHANEHGASKILTLEESSNIKTIINFLIDEKIV